MTLIARSTTATSHDRRFVGWTVQHPLGGYVVLAFVLSWACFVPAAVTGAAGFVVLGAFGPMAAAALVTRWNGGSVRAWFRGWWRWRVPFRYYLYALGLPPLLVLAVWLESALLGETVKLDPIGRLLPVYVVGLLLTAVLGGGQEEPGWRGFALDRHQAVHSPLGATVVLGLVWGAWHLPVYGLGGFAGPITLVVFYTWLWNRTGSVLLCALLHSSFNTAIAVLDLANANWTVRTTQLVTALVWSAALVAVTKGRLGLRT